MTKTRIIIPTTEGLSEIQSLTEEEDVIESAMFVDGGLDEPAVSERYRRFVDKRQGVIERETGHGSYRLDVSAEIDAGNSWQLPVYLAHRLLTLDMLAGYGSSADRIIVATGEVRLRGGDINVEKIEHVTQKIHQIASALGNESGIPLLFLLPEENANELSSTDLARLPSGTEIISIPHGPIGKQIIAEVLSGDIESGLQSPPGTVSGASRRLKTVGLVGLALVGISVGTFALSKTDTAIGEAIASTLREMGVLDPEPKESPNRENEKPTAPSLVNEAPTRKELPILPKPAPVETERSVVKEFSGRVVTAVSYEIKMAPLSLKRCSALRFQPEMAETRTYTSSNSQPVRITDAGRICAIRAELTLSKQNGESVFFVHRAETGSVSGRLEVVAVGTPTEMTNADSFVIEMTPDRTQELNGQFSFQWGGARSEKAVTDLAKMFGDRAKSFEGIKRESQKVGHPTFGSRILIVDR